MSKVPKGYLTLMMTWLWRWLPLRLSKRQSPLPTTVLLRTTLTRTIKLHYYMLPPDSNHLLYYKSKHRPAQFQSEVSAARSKTRRWNRSFSSLPLLSSQARCPKHISWLILVFWAQLQIALFQFQRQWFWSNSLVCPGELSGGLYENIRWAACDKQRELPIFLTWCESSSSLWSLVVL